MVSVNKESLPINSKQDKFKQYYVRKFKTFPILNMKLDIRNTFFVFCELFE